MYDSENFNYFAGGLGVEDITIGQNVSLIQVSSFLPGVFRSSFHSGYPGHATIYFSDVQYNTKAALRGVGHTGRNDFNEHT